MVYRDVGRPRRGHRRVRPGHVHGRDGSVRLRQVDPAALRGRPRPAHRRTVSIDGTELGDLGETALTRLRRDRVGFVFQAFNLVSSLTAEQNVALPARLAGGRPDPADAARGARRGRAGRPRAAPAGRALRRRAAAGGHRPGAVPPPGGGIRRRADRRAGRPHVAAGPRTAARAVDEHGQTVVMVTHDPVAAARADRVLLLADGRLVDELVDAAQTQWLRRSPRRSHDGPPSCPVGPWSRSPPGWPSWCSVASSTRPPRPGFPTASPPPPSW